MEESYSAISIQKFMLVEANKLPEDKKQKRKFLNQMLDDHINGRTVYPLFESPHDAVFFARNEIYSKRADNNRYLVYPVNLSYKLSLPTVIEDYVDEISLEKIKN